ncbi:MAG: SDR family NAD(P)-dependent oxidoreductase, partial [Symploca sp. SIO2G7]|nr:SDR family NAD(P)-dependent oxidoreductase [Symploca sp. SIO2G7]
KLVYVLPGGTDVVNLTKTLCQQLLALVQRLMQLPQAPRLYIVSTDDTLDFQLAQSALWGLTQTIQLEHPELRCTRIQTDSVSTLVKELLAESSEVEVVYKGTARQVARLEPYDQNSLLTRLVSTQPGTLTGLRWQPAQQRQPRADEVVIQIQATGLNFRDVLIAMGQYPEPASLGCECVGTVTQVGDSVTDLTPGQTVMAIAADSFAQSVTVHRDLVTPVPQPIAPTAAATLPVAFLTADYSLCHLANLQPGERVLIHAATGGVGQAAIQIAHRIGAEVFATASPGKQGVLRELGITHIMNSRTLDFADDVMTATKGQGVQVVLNSLPGEFRAKSLEILAAQGRFVEIGKGDGFRPEQITRLRPDVKHFTVDLAALCSKRPTLVQSMLRQLAHQVSAGIWSPLSVTEFTQNQAIQAFRTVQQAKHVGKVVVTQPQVSAKNRQTIQFQADATYLISGGLGGLGLIMARWMVDHGAKHIVLLSRRQPTADSQTAIGDLESRGTTVDVLAVDVTAREALAAALEGMAQDSRFPGGIKGIVHAAGTLDDDLIQQLDWAQFERVLAPKVAGAWYLHTLTKDTDLDFFILFSSAAALLGSPGQANHAAANSFLDGLAHYRQRCGLPGLSINWGAWSSVGSALKYQRQGSLKHLPGVEVISPQQGLAKLEQIWSTAAAQVGIVPINWSEFLTQSLVKHRLLFQNLRNEASPDALQAIPQDVSQAFLEQLANTPPENQRQLLDTHICQQVCQTLGFSPDELDLEAGFFDLGMDSLTALELKNSLQNSLGLSLPSTLVFDYPTVAALLDYLASQLLETNVPTAEISQDSDRLETAERLSEEQLADLMDKKLADIEKLLGEGDSL